MPFFLCHRKTVGTKVHALKQIWIASHSLLIQHYHFIIYTKYYSFQFNNERTFFMYMFAVKIIFDLIHSITKTCKTVYVSFLLDFSIISSNK